jgi:transposase
MRVGRPPRRRYDLSFQHDAVALLDQTDRSIRAVAEDLGLPQSTLYAWYNRAMAKKKGKLPSSKTSPSSSVMATSDPQTDKDRIAQLERELEVLRKKNEQLEMDRAILKKAAAFFAKESE